MDSNVRPVWLTREQREALYGDRRERAIAAVAEAWDAAPADATEAVRHAVQAYVDRVSVGQEFNPSEVLRALGCPNEILP